MSNQSNHELTTTGWRSIASALGWIIPDWPAPVNVNAVCTTRQGGVSAPPFDSLNLGDHVGDNANAVAENRQRVIQTMGLSTTPLWLEQVHGVTVATDSGDTPTADASVVTVPGQVSVIMTADCLPVLFCNQQGTRVASAHAGWRGLCDGVLEQTLTALASEAGDVMAWLGPAIGPDAFEVGDEVRTEFMVRDPRAERAFRPGNAPGKWWANIYELARQRLEQHGVEQIYGGGFCTVSEPERFFSYRRDGKTGRMASLIWMD